ncbi:MAG: DUF3820 family protein [Planctomycetota bacterium]
MSPEDLGLSHEVLTRLLEWRMPFGRYAGTVLIDLPEPYLLWFAQRGYPAGELGKLLELATVIKGEGLLSLFDPLRRQRPAARE